MVAIPACGARQRIAVDELKGLGKSAEMPYEYSGVAVDGSVPVRVFPPPWEPISLAAAPQTPLTGQQAVADDGAAGVNTRRIELVSARRAGQMKIAAGAKGGVVFDDIPDYGRIGIITVYAAPVLGQAVLAGKADQGRPAVLPSCEGHFRTQRSTVDDRGTDIRSVSRHEIKRSYNHVAANKAEIPKVYSGPNQNSVTVRNRIRIQGALDGSIIAGHIYQSSRRERESY